MNHFLKISDYQIINANGIVNIEWGSNSDGRDYTCITYQGGEALRFEDDEAELVRAYFTGIAQDLGQVNA